MRILWLAVMVACSGDKDPDSGIEETDTDSGDTGEVVALGLNGFVVKPDDVPRKGELRIALVEAVGNPVGIGPTLSSAEVTGTGVFKLDLPDDPGATGLWMPLVHDDANEDQIVDDDEVIAGVGLDRWVTWDGTEWTAVDPDLQDDLTLGTATSYVLADTESRVELRGLDAEVRIHGTYTGAQEGALGIVGIDYHVVSDGSGSDVPGFDKQMVADAFDVTLDQRPSAQHFYSDVDHIVYAREATRLYLDDDFSGEWQPGEQLDIALCSSGAPFRLRWVETPVTLAGAVQLERLQWTSGWRAVTAADAEIASPDVTYLSTDDSCVD